LKDFSPGLLETGAAVGAGAAASDAMLEVVWMMERIQN
jgi:hypothetical protein